MIFGKVLRLCLVFFIGLALIFASTGTVLTPVIGSELQEKERELQQVSREIERKERELQQIKAQQKTISNEINVIEADIDKTESEIEYFCKKLQLLDMQIAEVKEDLDKTQKSVEERTNILSQRLKSIYQNGEVQYIEVLLDSSSFGEFLTCYDLLQRIAKQDVTLIKQIEEEFQYIEQQKLNLEKIYSDVKFVKEKSEEKKKHLEEQKKAKEEKLDAIKDQKEEAKKALEELEKMSKHLERIICELQSKSGQAPTGKMIWPVQSYISSDYGMRIHPILKERRMHMGIDLPASRGTPIKAAQSGKVLFTGWLGAYGKSTVIDHGGGISTFYAHQDSILVKVGQSVSQGQIIGRVGSTGWSTGPHLHFEVRINGKHTNPHEYLK